MLPTLTVHSRGYRSLYALSKMSNIIVSNVIQREHSSFLVSCAVHPGGVVAEGLRHLPKWQKALIESVLYPVPMGAYTQLWAGTSEEGEGFGGKYLVAWARVGKADPRAGDEQSWDKLKQWLDGEVQPYLA